MDLVTEKEFASEKNSSLAMILKIGPEDLKRGRVPFVFENVPRGIYAIRSFQDANGNGRLDKGIFGRPQEPWGVHRDERPFFRGPKFGEVAFEVQRNITQIKIELK